MKSRFKNFGIIIRPLPTAWGSTNIKNNFKVGFDGFHHKPPSGHQCAKNILVVQSKDSDIWCRVRNMPRHIDYRGPFLLCRHISQVKILNSCAGACSPWRPQAVKSIYIKFISEFLVIILDLAQVRQFLKTWLNPHAPVAQKIADEAVFRRFQGEEVEFFKIGPHWPPIRFLMRIFLETIDLSPSRFRFSVVFISRSYF